MLVTGGIDMKKPLILALFILGGCTTTSYEQAPQSDAMENDLSASERHRPAGIELPKAPVGPMYQIGKFETLERTR